MPSVRFFVAGTTFSPRNLGRVVFGPAGAPPPARWPSGCPGKSGRSLVRWCCSIGRTFYPPAAAVLGLDLSTAIVVQAATAQDELWALEQVLRSPGIGIAWCAIDKLNDRSSAGCNWRPNKGTRSAFCSVLPMHAVPRGRKRNSGSNRSSRPRGRSASRIAGWSGDRRSSWGGIGNRR